jgi:hypothetical protein
MIPENSIEIHVLYSSRTNRECSFFEIIKNEMFLNSEHEQPSGFWGLDGGLEIVINGYCSIFRSTDFLFSLDPHACRLAAKPLHAVI